MSVKYCQNVRSSRCDRRQQWATSKILGQGATVLPLLDFNRDTGVTLAAPTYRTQYVKYVYTHIHTTYACIQTYIHTYIYTLTNLHRHT